LGVFAFCFWTLIITGLAIRCLYVSTNEAFGIDGIASSHLSGTKQTTRSLGVPNRNMSFQTLRLLIVFVCVWLLLFHEQDVNGMRNIDLVLKGHERRMHEAKKDVVSFHPKSSSERASSSSDPSTESKRRVRRGSDPIHNRC
jgi:cytochrome b subunit of formate dehydrogenase